MKISVITVCLNPTDEFMLTAESVLAQDHDDVEWVVIDGLSWSTGVAYYDMYEASIDKFIREADSGVYHAMNKAWEHATGDYIVFLNSGDIFFRSDTLSDVAKLIEDETDVFYGDHVFVSKGVNHFNRASEFSALAEKLKRGNVKGLWHSRFPCHQATFYRRTLFKEMGYDLSLKICADHDLLLRAYWAGKKIVFGNITVCRYFGGGFSAQSQQRCSNEWATVYSRYSNFPDTIRQTFLDVAQAQRISTTSSLRILSGHYGIEGPYPQFGGYSLAWVGESGLKMIALRDMPNPQLRIRGRVTWPQNLRVMLKDKEIGFCAVQPDVFTTDIELSEDIPAGTTLTIVCDDVRQLGEQDTRRAGWCVMEIELFEAVANTEEDERALAFKFEVEGDVSGEWLSGGFAPIGENRRFRWMEADRGTIMPKLEDPIWLESISVDTGYVDLPDFPNVRLTLDIDGSPIAQRKIKSKKRKRMSFQINRYLSADTEIGLTPSHKFVPPGDSRNLSLKFYGVTLIGKAVDSFDVSAN